MNIQHDATPENKAKVSALSAYGVNQDEIALYLEIDKKTLRKHYRIELDTSKTKAHKTVAKFLYAAASGRAIKDGATHADCLRAAMFWAKTQMGFREVERVENNPDKEKEVIQYEVIE